MAKKKREKYVDDGHTIFNMDVDGMPHRRVQSDKSDLNLTRKEKWALIKCAFGHYFPIFLVVLLCFSLAMLLIYFWLK